MSVKQQREHRFCWLTQQPVDRALLSW